MSTDFGLDEAVIQKINNVFAKFAEIDEVVIYGSRAKGNFKKGSDLDLVIKGTKLNNDLLNKVWLALDDLLLPYTIDLSIFSYIENQDLIEHINRAGKALYKKI